MSCRMGVSEVDTPVFLLTLKPGLVVQTLPSFPQTAAIFTAPLPVIVSLYESQDILFKITPRKLYSTGNHTTHHSACDWQPECQAPSRLMNRKARSNTSVYSISWSYILSNFLTALYRKSYRILCNVQYKFKCLFLNT